MEKSYIYFAFAIIIICVSCGEASQEYQAEVTNEITNRENILSSADTLREINVEMLKQALNMNLQEKDGQFKVVVPQNDLDVVVDSFKIIPPMGLGSWVAFAPTAEQVMVMGDIVVTESELKPIQQEVINQGLSITAIHNHFVRIEPDIWYMHIGGTGDENMLGKSVKAIFDKVSELRGGNPADAETTSVENGLNIKMIDSIIGFQGQMNNGVYKITIGRPDVELREHGAPVSTFLGFHTWASWQGTNEKAAVAGDFTMLEDEVASVIMALVANDIEVVAVHNHMIHEEPRIFFLHYWGVGSAEKLAKGLKAALDQTGK